MAKKVIAPDSLEAVLNELSKEATTVLDSPFNDEEKKAFVIFYNTLRTIAEQAFEYLPEGDKSDVVTMSGSWMCVGLLLGRSPKLLEDILKRTRAKIEQAKG